MTAHADRLTLPARRGARLLALRYVRDAADAHGRMGSDGEALHDFRVALRRLRATLSEYRGVLRPGVRRKDRARAAALVRPTGAARDAEVHAAWVEGVLARLADEERTGAERFLDELRTDAAASEAAAHGFGRFRRRLSRRLATYRVSVETGEGAGSSLADVLSGRMAAAAEGLRSALDAVCEDASGEALHRARLAGKRLRYLVEPFAAELDGGEALVERLKAMQALLGGLNDLRLLGERIGRGIRDAGDGSDAEHATAGLRALGQLAEEERERGMRDVRQMCGAEPIEQLVSLAETAAASAERKAKGNNEIERKYLLRCLPRLPPGTESVEIWQGWIPGERLHERIRRVRRADGAEAWFRTVKLGAGVVRVEVEEEAPADVGRKLWPLTRGKRIRKRRWKVPAEGGLVWEVDRFTGRELVLAEIELPRPDHPVTIPEWLRPCLVREVTGDPRYVNLNLAR